MFPNIQDGLNAFHEWCVDNSLNLNVRKTKSLILGSNFKTSGIDLDNRFVINGESLEYTAVYNYLGIILDVNMLLLPLLTYLLRTIIEV